LVANVRSMGQALEVKPDDVMVSWLPLYHDMGLIGAWFGPLYFAIPLVIMSPLTFLARPERWLQAIHRYRGTISGAPNFAYEACISRIPDATLADMDLSCWRVAFNGAEAVSPKTLDKFCNRFAAQGFRREAMMPVYGLAENCVGLAFPPLTRGPKIDYIDRDALMSKGRAETIERDDPRAIALPGCGFPIPGHQIRLVDDSGQEVPDRVQARIEFQGPSATSGYFRNPEATAALFDGEWRDSKDLGYTVDGELFVTGRVKDMIIRGGRNIFPVELEEAVGNLDGIQQGSVAAFGSPDPETGTERLVVMAEFRRRDPDAQEKMRVAISELSIDVIGMPPDVVSLVPPRSVPKTSSGKIRRQAAKTLFETGHAGGSTNNVRWQLIRMGLSSVLPWARRYLSIAAHRTFGIYAWFVLLAVSPLAWILVSLVPNPELSWRIARTAVRLMQMLTRLTVQVDGIENLPRQGPMILAANHSSYLDGVALVAGLAERFSFVVKGELVGNFVPRIFLRRLGALFVERFAAEQSLADAAKITNTIRDGGRVIYFPEGTFSRMPGLLPFQMGTFIAAAQTGAPIIPVAIRGTRHILRDKMVLPRPGSVRILIGPPIVVGNEIDGVDQWSAAVSLRDKTRAALLSQTGEPDLAHERVVPAGAPNRSP
ncbi:MAG: AMP-binding protein, partial [Proteobacteria bacterium]|nr:AMP-binding protein [Pseudomonadota bacterium]